MFRGPAYRLPMLALAIGVCVGVATSFLQTHLDSPWLALVNSVSPWLTTAFVAGALQSTMRHAVVVGMLATLAQVAGYYVTAEIRGFSASLFYVGLWSACAILGGPIFGAAGHSWRRSDPAGLGAALLSATYISEGLVGYQIRLGYTSSAVLFVIIGLLIAVGIGRHRSQSRSVAVWFLPALVAGAFGQLAIGAIAG